MAYYGCSQCGNIFHESEFAETVEEFLCESCASGITEEEPDDYGVEDGFQEESEDGK